MAMTEAALLERRHASALIGSSVCLEYKNDPVQCIGCVLVSKCPAGQCVVDELEMETKAGNHGPLPERKMVTDKTTEGARERFETALASGDPIQWYLANTGMTSRASAQAFVNKCKRRYPDIWGKYSKPQESAAPARKVSPAKKAKPVQKGKVAQINAQRTAQAKDNLRRALESGDAVQWYLDNCNLAKKMNAQSTLSHAKKKYPDVVAEFERGCATEAPHEETTKVESDTGTKIKMVDLEQKAAELADRKAKILDEITKLNEEIDEIEKQENCIRMVMKMF